MKKKPFDTRAFLLLFLFIALLFYGNYQFAITQPGGTDFLYRWLPTRLVLFEGYQNPYSSDVEYQVELMHHGHARQGDETPGIFAYPYYTMVVIFPFALIEDFTIARAAWMTLSVMAYIVIIFLTLGMIEYKPMNTLLTSLILFSLLSADFAQALIDGNPSGLATLFAVLSLYFLSRKSDGLAGIFLALSTIKPQLVILFCVLIVLWAFFQRRWVVVISSGITLGVLLGLSFIVQPSWLMEFIKDITTYPDVASPSTPRAILAYWMPETFAGNIALGLTLLSVFILFSVWKKCLKGDFSDLLWAACITFTIMPFTGITSAKSNYIAMLPGLILLIKYEYQKFREREIVPSIFLLIWIGLSWLFFYAGRNWVIGGDLIYFVDFYPLPMVLLVLYFLVSLPKSSVSPKTPYGL
jgi:hypothetical protein